MAGRLRTIDARTLADAVLEPPGYAVKDLLVQGLHILAGAPKTGKSWLALWLCQQVAGGEKVWGHPTQQGTVLYLCLEDGYHRLQDRLLDITEDPSENLYLATHAGTLADGLAGQIETFVREHGRVSLIVIDTLQKLRETCTDNTYARDYADLARLKKLADRCRTTVLLVHHLRKQYDSDPLNRVSGTAGMSGAADGTFILQREDGSSNYGTLFCTGRDIESKELKLQFDPMSHIWECREDEETARSADEEVIVDIAKKYDMAVMGPNCTGYVNNVGKVKMWGMGGTEFNMAERGTGIAFFAQSGTMAIHALSCNYVDISYVFSMGNSVMLSIEDLMEYAVEDPEVNMLCLYLEGVRHGRRFMNVLKRARELGKPVVIHASGMSKKGAIAAASHTGNLASSRNVYKAVCEKYGVVLVESIDEFLCAANVLSAWHGHMPKGGRIAAVNGSGGENAVCADLGELYDVPMPDLQPETIAKLKAVLPEFASPRNPLDMTAITSDTEKSAALITDGRFSGVTTGAVIGHVSPEAALGGPIGLVQDGDIIEYDTIEGYINLLVS